MISKNHPPQVASTEYPRAALRIWVNRFFGEENKLLLCLRACVTVVGQGVFIHRVRWLILHFTPHWTDSSHRGRRSKAVCSILSLFSWQPLSSQIDQIQKSKFKFWHAALLQSSSVALCSINSSTQVMSRPIWRKNARGTHEFWYNQSTLEVHLAATKMNRNFGWRRSVYGVIRCLGGKKRQYAPLYVSYVCE